MTMTEIAKETGVSQATVSRVLSGRGGVSQKKADAIIACAKKMKFKLTVRKPRQVYGQKNIGLYCTEGRFERSNSTLLNKYNTIAGSLPPEYNALLLPAGLSPDKLQKEINRRGIVGLLITGHSNSPELRRIIDKIPHVWMNSHDNLIANSLLCGNDDAGRIAAQYLIDSGCTSLAAIRVPSRNPGYAARIDGFLNEASVHSLNAVVLPCGGDKQYFEDLDINELEDIIDKTFGSLEDIITRCDGFFCPDDLVTAVLYRILHKHNISLFGGVRVVSCNNDVRSLAGLYPRPATIDFAPALTAELSIKDLMQQLKDNTKDSRVVITVRPALIIDCH